MHLLETQHAWHTKVARAVQFVHQRLVLHRDLKPSNILLTIDGEPLVCDFGLARRIDESQEVTLPGHVLGTRKYMAPEQMDGRRDLTVTADVWALGAILYELLTGRPPFVDARARLDEEQKLRNPEPESVGARNPLLRREADLAWICARCLQLDPAQRYQSAEALADDLQRYREGRRVRPRRSWRQQLARLTRPLGGPMREQDYLARWRICLCCEAALTLLCHVVMFGLLQTGQAGPVLWIWWFLTDGVLVWTVWLVPQSRRVLSLMEQEVQHLWIGLTIVAVILFALHCPLLGPADASAVLRVYPAWAAVHGLVFFVEGKMFWGRLYGVGLLLFAAALVLPTLGPVAPIIYGLLNSSSLAGMASQTPPTPAELVRRS